MITASHTQFEPNGSFCGYDSLLKVHFQPYGNALLLPHKYLVWVSYYMTRYEYEIVLRFNIINQDNLSEVLRTLENRQMFFGEREVIKDEDYDYDYYEPKNIQEEKVEYTIMLDDKPLFADKYKSVIFEFYNQITENGWNPTITEEKRILNKIHEPKYPTFAFLYLTGGEFNEDTITGEDNKTLNVHYNIQDWRNELLLTFHVEWYTDSKKSPSEIEDTMKNYFIEDIKSMQNNICSVFELCEYADTEDFTLDCKFKAYSHYEQKCTPEVREQLINRLGEEE